MSGTSAKAQQSTPPNGAPSSKNLESEIRESNKERKAAFNLSLGVLTGLFTLFLVLHILGIYLFLSGFLLTRLVLDDKSECGVPPIQLSHKYEAGSVDNGCWHPKTFDKAVVVIVDALRYDFTVPFQASSSQSKPQHFHDALTIFHETASSRPEHAVLLPFIADPPTTTLQRLKGLTTGTLPTFIDAGSNFAGTAIDEDNIVAQLRNASKTVVHLGDDTWHSLFPGYFDPELTRAYDSFNVWDLFTVDNGVTEHIFPLLDKANSSRWDVIFGHYLGVDHAGHRYGPDHPAMSSKLKEMNDVFTRMMDAIDDRTLLVVMGDHGMDSKGDHGGESDDEIEAAIWLYSKKRAFGRRFDGPQGVPATAKERPVRQIDLVPTLSLLLGLPIPFNNLGKPIDEVFIGTSNSDYPNLAKVNRITAAQIHRYQKKYTAARKIDPAVLSRVDGMWTHSKNAWGGATEMEFPPIPIWRSAYEVFSDYQKENLQVCRDLWARFDNKNIMHGIEVITASFLLLLIFARGLEGERTTAAPIMLLRGGVGSLVGGTAGFVAHTIIGLSPINTPVYCTAVGGLGGIASVFYTMRQKVKLLHSTFWGWFGSVTVLLLCIGFAANSFTIWEDEILLFFLTTFGVLMGLASLKRTDSMDRFLGITQSVGFVVFTRAASFSRLCREEQMPYCKSTYYASATSSTSSWWQLLIPFVVSALLPSAIRDFFIRSQNYHGSAVIWLGIVLRIGLTLTAVYWLLDSADDNAWFPSISSSTLKSSRVLIAQVVLALAYAAGYSTYVWAAPFITVEERPAAPAAPVSTPQKTTSAPVDPSNPQSEIFTSLAPSSPAPPQNKPQILIYGYANTFGTRYFLLATVWVLPLLLVTKPMGQAALSLLLLSILSLLETLDALDLRHSPLGPVALALLGNYHFFKTGHQATLSSIQWEAAFVPLTTVRYPWSPLLVTLNFFAPVILCAVAVPAIRLWKVPPRTGWRELLDGVARDLGTYLAVYAAIALATTVEASWLRRHLMLYRIFMPRMLLAVGGLGVAGVFGILIGLVGVRWAVGSVGEVFGWG
ncbi:GPI ethanolamine phosphate transferase-like protein [Elsinoe australis]|uniref:GPI ethanolamine phosphate transferase-like protein n=1 Tax=Elsinoe australis TaxID=40998 RepID=A0A4U7BH01_9PEZI|nr:GPI ethanolamine phosphate transferase-like protein [Elsinoe australis]